MSLDAAKYASPDERKHLLEMAQAVSLILILSDINMSGMTGLELLPKAKTLRPDVPVIMITAYADFAAHMQHSTNLIRDANAGLSGTVCAPQEILGGDLKFYRAMAEQISLSELNFIHCFIQTGRHGTNLSSCRCR